MTVGELVEKLFTYDMNDVVKIYDREFREYEHICKINRIRRSTRRTQYADGHIEEQNFEEFVALYS